MHWKQRFSNFKKAYAQLCDFSELQDLLKEKGFQDAIGPRPVIEQSFQSGYILDGEGWMEMLKMRN